MVSTWQVIIQENIVWFEINEFSTFLLGIPENNTVRKSVIYKINCYYYNRNYYGQARKVIRKRCDEHLDPYIIQLEGKIKWGSKFSNLRHSVDNISLKFIQISNRKEFSGGL